MGNVMRKILTSLLVILIGLGLGGCSTPAGWKTRLSGGVYQFVDGGYSIESPISPGMCLDIQEFDEPHERGAQFRECHGYIQAVYVASLVTSARDLNEKTFIEITKTKAIPEYLEGIFEPHANAELVSIDVSSVHGSPAVFFSGVANLPDGKARVLSARVLLDSKTILSASVVSSLDAARYGDSISSSPAAVEEEFQEFVRSIKRLAR
jgi:hypothetical protein